MQEWTEADINSYLEALTKNDTWDLAFILFTAADLRREPQSQPLPTGHVKVVSYLEQLIEDRRSCIVNRRIPYAYGEMRWLAARVLACEYAYLGIDKPIILKDVVQPIRDSEIARIDQFRPVEELIQDGLLPTKTEIIKPQDYAECCSKEAVEERRRNQMKKE